MLDRDLVATTPNMTYVPEYPFIDSEGLYIREDGTWGPHEYTRWPQMYSSLNLHHFCIPVMPRILHTLNSGVDSITDTNLWREFTESDWMEIDKGPEAHDILVCGLLNEEKRHELAQAFYLNRQRARERCASSEFKEVSDLKLVETLSTLGEQAIERLADTPGPYYACLVTARELQRLTLEFVGYINLVDVVRPRMRNPTYRTSQPLPFRGVFTPAADVVQELYRIGIPTWYIRDAAVIGPNMKIFSVGHRLPFSACVHIARPIYRDRTVYIGDFQPIRTNLRSPNGELAPDSAITDLISAMRTYSRGSIHRQQRLPSTDCSGPSFSSIRSVQPVDSRSDIAEPSKHKRQGSNSVQASSAPKRLKEEKGKQEASPGSLVFTIPDGLVPGTRDLPSVAKHWLAAVKAIGLHKKKRPDDAALYFHPPPFLFDPHDTERLARYYLNYVRIERFLRQRMKEGSLFGHQAYKIRQWRDVLYGDYIRSKEIDPASTSSLVIQVNDTIKPGSRSISSDHGSTRMHDRKKRGRAAEVRVTFAVQGKFEPYSPDMVATWWRTGKKVTLNDVKGDHRLCQDILWDLHATGFIHDLWTIDMALVPRSGMSPAQIMERSLLLASVYGGTFTTEDGRKGYTLSPSKMSNFWSNIPDIEALGQFSKTVQSWPDCPEVLRGVDVAKCNSELRDVIYGRITKFFVDTCIKVHDRLPTIPCFIED